MASTGETFEARSELTLKEYFKTMYQTNQNLIRVVVLFDKAGIRGKQVYGSASQEDLGDKVRCEFMMDSLDYMAQWLLSFGKAATVEEPETLKEKMSAIVEELYEHLATKSLKPLET
jgi:predicted DNA-binding transcriptional regulator YafY